jgi:predicted ArsR family transcriptional regulator
MTNNDITEEELQRAILAAAVKPKPGFKPGEVTAPRIAKQHGITEPRARIILSNLCEKGVVERKIIVFIDSWGVRQSVRGYKLIKKE